MKLDDGYAQKLHAGAVPHPSLGSASSALHHLPGRVVQALQYIDWSLLHKRHREPFALFQERNPVGHEAGATSHLVQTTALLEQHWRGGRQVLVFCLFECALEKEGL